MGADVCDFVDAKRDLKGSKLQLSHGVLAIRSHDLL